MTQTALRPEPLEDKAARWLNIGMLWLLGLALFSGFAWEAIARWPVVIPALRGDPGTSFNDLSPWSFGLMTIANLTLWTRGTDTAKRGFARWMSWISGAVGLLAFLLLWAGWGWLIYRKWALAAAGLRPWPKPDTLYVSVMILFGLATVAILAVILKRLVARKPSSPA